MTSHDSPGSGSRRSGTESWDEPADEPRSGAIRVGGDVSGGVLSTGAGARIRYEQATVRGTGPEAARLLEAISALRSGLRGDPAALAPGFAVQLDGQLADAEHELERAGDLGGTSRQLLHDRVGLLATAAAGGSSLAALAGELVRLLS